MGFHPLSVVNLPAILLVKPPDKTTRTKARGINRKVIFNTLKWQTTDRDKLGQEIGQGRIGEVP
jgi:hypothetical protein